MSHLGYGSQSGKYQTETVGTLKVITAQIYFILFYFTHLHTCAKRAYEYCYWQKKNSDKQFFFHLTLVI